MYSLGVRTSAREGRGRSSTPETLAQPAATRKGRPIAAIINSMASRTPSGTGIFIAVRPRPGVTDMRSKVLDLHKEIARIAAQRGARARTHA